VYAPAEAGFEIRFPSEPTETVNSETDVTTRTAGVPRADIEDLGFSCTWFELQEPPEHLAEQWGYLLAFQEEGAERGRILSERELMLDGNLGREFVFTLSENGVVRCRVIVFGTRIIQLIVLGKDEQAVRLPEAEAFFESLKFDEKS
jgi:hypothetical protein